MNHLSRITTDPAVMGEKPCLRSLHVTVGTILGLLASGRTRDEILNSYPYLETGDIDEAIAYDKTQFIDEAEEQNILNYCVTPGGKGRQRKPLLTSHSPRIDLASLRVQRNLNASYHRRPSLRSC